jgi:glycosyltransferase involved in cell wall biosynthesis
VSSFGTRARPHLLFLCQTLPYPPDGGVWIRTYHVLRLLARAFDITALCFERAPMAGNAAALDAAAGCAALSQFARVEVFRIPQRHSRVRFAWDHIRSTARRRVYTTYLFDSNAFQRRLDEILRSTPVDLVHMDSVDLGRYLDSCRDVPVVCVHHDVNSALLRRRAEVERSEFRRAYLRHQARLMQDAERQWCPRVALNVMVSEQDRVALQAIAPGARVAIVPNGVDVDEFQPNEAPARGVAYVGGLHWFPNLDAIEFFGREILPCLRAATDDPPVRWIGSASAEQRERFRNQFGIEVTGYVDDVRPCMQAAACHIVPLRAGGGTRLKILNSWAMGKPVVSTSIGCEGLAAVDGDNILIRDDPKAFARAVDEVLAHPDLGRRLGQSGRVTVERQYSWDVIGRDLIDTYLAIANAGAGDRMVESLSDPVAAGGR